jgi:hypothetical protein
LPFGCATQRCRVHSAGRLPVRMDERVSRGQSVRPGAGGVEHRRQLCDARRRYPIAPVPPHPIPVLAAHRMSDVLWWADYRQSTGVLQWEAGVGGPKQLYIPLMARRSGPWDRSFSVLLHDNVGVALGFPAAAAVSIGRPSPWELWCVAVQWSGVGGVRCAFERTPSNARVTCGVLVL